MVLSQLRAPVTKLMHPLYRILVKLGIHPNMLTLIGLALGLLAGWAFATGSYLVAAVTIVLSGFLDMLDGGVARVGGYASDEGAFLDSFADRLGESAIYIGLVLGASDLYHQIVALSMLVFSYSVSYLRARGEGLGVSLAGIGVMERAERMTALFFVALLSAIYGEWILLSSLFFVMILVMITVIHRFVKVYGSLKIAASN